MLVRSDVSQLRANQTGEMPRLNIGSSWEVIRSMYRHSYIEWPNSVLPKYGDNFYIPIFNTYIICNPKLTYDLMVRSPAASAKGSFFTKELGNFMGKSVFSSDGEDWKFTRHLLKKEFAKPKVMKHFGDMSALIAQHTGELSSHVENNKPLDISDMAYHLTFNFISTFLFKRDLSHLFPEIHVGIKSMFDVFEQRFAGPLGLIPCWTPIPLFLRTRRYRENLLRQVRKLLSETSNTSYHSELGKLFSDITVVDKIKQQEEEGSKSSRWTEEEILFLIVAGHETTATGVGWMAYAVAQNAELQEQLFSEIKDTSLIDEDAQALWNRLTLHKQVVSESLRLYPPLPIYARYTDVDIRLGNVTIPKRTHIKVVNFVTHRHPEYWSNPNKFDPDRFSESRLKNIEQGSYLPFSLGPRSCTGADMGFAQMVLTLAHLVKNFRFKLANSRQIILRPSVSLRANEPIKLALEHR